MALVKLTSGKNFWCDHGMSILEAAKLGKVWIPYSCKTGRCSACKCKILSGETKPLIAELGLTEIEKAEGWILSCVRTADTDLVLEIDDLEGMLLHEAKTLACRINSLGMLAPDVIKVVLRLPPGTIFNYHPGQYIDVIGPGGMRRSYSIANAPKADNTIELHIRAVEGGAMSDYWFKRAAVNDLLRLHGPLGTFFLRNIAERSLIFLATGTGFAPVKAMLEALPSLAAAQQPSSITVIWGARYEHDLYLEVSDLTGSQNFIPVLSRADVLWQGERGHIQDALLRRMPDLRNAVVYASGSGAMIQSAKSTLTAAGLPRQHYYSDAFVCSNTLVL